MSIGELFDGTVETAAGLTTERHLVFDWGLLESAWTASDVRAVLEARESAFGPGRWPTAVLSNHDRPRQASRLADSIGVGDGDAIARAAAVLSLTVRGTPFLYYGEELGMGDVDIPPDESVDPPAFRFGPGAGWWDRSRCRTPMPWSPGPGSGFTTGRPWLRLGPDAETRNVQVQMADPTSVLSSYRRLIALRASTPALQVGSLRTLTGGGPEVVAYVREIPGQAILVLLNLGREAAGWRLSPNAGESGWRPLFGTARATPPDGDIPAGTMLTLGPDECLILEGIRGPVSSAPLLP
jgi:glycosidase